MDRTKRSLNTKAFSLIELMVVVAIIGILAAVAIPNIQKYMNKSKQTEAKINLSAIYTAEKTYHTEKNSYDATFTDIGYKPEGSFIYDIGFSSAPSGDTPNKIWGYCQIKRENGAVIAGFQDNATTACTFLHSSTRTQAITNANCNSTAFTAKAIVILNTTDTWSIDQDKRLVQISSGE